MSSLIKDIKKLYYKSKLTSAIQRQWSILMDSISDSKSSNQLQQDYEILNVFEKHYGFDAIVSIPVGKSLSDFNKLIPAISSSFKSRIIAEYSSSRNSFYLRFHKNGFDINFLSDIRFKWNSFFFDNKYRTAFGETFSISNPKKIYHPSKVDDDKKKLVIGYRFNVQAPVGLSYTLLEGSILDLNKVYPACTLQFDTDTNTALVEILASKVDNEEKFEPIECKNYELYVGMTHSYIPILLNFKNESGVIIGGCPNSGKTVAMIMAMLNLILQYDEKYIEMYICMLSDKQDLRAFKNTAACKYYANNIDDALKELRYLNNMVKERNELFNQCDEFIVNIFDYNKLHKDNPLPIAYFILDEVASFSINGAETATIKEKKNKCTALLWKLAREARSAGVYIIIGTQRGTVENLSANIKGLLCNQICFYVPNMASAQTILGDSDLAKLALKQKTQREFIALCHHQYQGKTLYLDNNMILNYLKPYIIKDKKFMKLNKKGKIIQHDSNDIDEDLDSEVNKINTTEWN